MSKDRPGGTIPRRPDGIADYPERNELRPMNAGGHPQKIAPKPPPPLPTKNPMGDSLFPGPPPELPPPYVTSDSIGPALQADIEKRGREVFGYLGENAAREQLAWIRGWCYGAGSVLAGTLLGYAIVHAFRSLG